MGRFCDLLSDEGRVNWWRLCKEFGVNPDQVEKDERRIHLQGKLESLEQIDRLMRKSGRGAWHE